jgi:hypothetical protein
MIDPNIALSFKSPEIPDPAEVQARAIALQNARQQQQSGALDLQMKQRDLQDQEIMRQSYMDSNGDLNQFERLIMGRGASPKAIFAFKQQMLAQKEQLAKTNKEELANTAERHDQLRGAMQSFAQQSPDFKQQNWQTFLKQQANAGNMTPAEYQQHLQNFSAYPGDDQLKMDMNSLATGSQLAKEVVEQQNASSNATSAGARATTANTGQAKFNLEKQGLEIGNLARTIADVKDQAGYDKALQGVSLETRAQLPPTFSPEAVQTIKRMAVPVKDQPQYDIDSYKAKMGLIGNSEYDQFLARYSQALGKTPATLSPEEGLASFQKFAELKQDPVMRQNAIEMKGLQMAMLKIQQGQIPTDSDYQLLAKSVIDHSLAPSQFAELRSGRMGPLSGTKVFAMAKQMDPNFSMEKADADYKAMQSTEQAFTSGKQADMSRSLNNAMEHLGLLDQAREALKNGDIRALNAVGNWFGIQTGSSAQTVYDLISKKVGDEVAKSFVPGGGGQGERMMSGEDFSEKLGDKQISGNIRGAIHLLDSQQRNLQDQYKRGTYGQGAQQLFTPQAMAIRDRLLGGQQQQQQPAAAPNGGYVRTADGPKGHKIGQKADGSWYDVETGKKVQ